MRKTIASVLAVALVTGAFVLPAGANNGKKKKKIHETFTVQLAPFPKLAAWGDPIGLTRPGCLAGEQGVNWDVVEFSPPAAGTLTAYMEGFAGDWDLHLLDGDDVLLSSQEDQIQGGAPARESLTLKMKPKDTVGIAPCNWLGEPEVEVHYEFEFKGVGKKKGQNKKKNKN